MDGEFASLEMDGFREYEDEYDNELDGEVDGEFEGDPFLSTLGQIAQGVGSMFGLGEGEFEDEYEDQYALESDGEEFLGTIGRYLRRARPALQQAARVAMPMINRAVSTSPLGMLGGLMQLGLREDEYELEWESDPEADLEGDPESDFAGPSTSQEALAELMAAIAAQSPNEAEAEAMMGAAVITSISASDRARLLRLIPSLMRGAAILTRVLRRQTVTRPMIRIVPTIFRQTTRTLARRAAAGQPTTRRIAARVMAAHTQRALANPRVATTALRRNLRATTPTRAPRPSQQRRTSRPARPAYPRGSTSQSPRQRRVRTAN